MPASSPGEASAISTSKPRFCGPAQVHAQQHLGPVLGVGAARAAVHRDRRVAGVVAAAEQALLLELAHAPLDVARAARASSAAHRLVLGGELGQPGEVLDLGLERAERLELARRAAVLGGHRRGPLLVVPEAGLLHLGLEARGLALQLSGVKGSPRAASAGRGAWRRALGNAARAGPRPSTRRGTSCTSCPSRTSTGRCGRSCRGRRRGASRPRAAPRTPRPRRPSRRSRRRACSAASYSAEGCSGPPPV